jgi:hypothetical protein
MPRCIASPSVLFWHGAFTCSFSVTIHNPRSCTGVSASSSPSSTETWYRLGYFVGQIVAA